MGDFAKIEEAYDIVERPSHYAAGRSIETIEYIEDLLKSDGYTATEGYYIGNIIKYLSRYKRKNGVEDLRKALTYLNWLIEEQEED